MNNINNTNYRNLPNEKGYYGSFGGSFLPAFLAQTFRDLEIAFAEIKNDENFIREYQGLLKNFVGRPSPLYHAKNISQKLGGAQIYFKREDLNHTGAHKINHCLGEALLAKRLGKKKVMAETGAGQHGVALATAAAVIGLECDIYMGEIDAHKQVENVKKMRLLGAKVIIVKVGGRSLKEAVDGAFEAYLKEYEHAFFAIGSVVGPHPYPAMLTYFQSIVSRELREQLREIDFKKPDMLIACVGGGSNAIGLFHDFLDELEVELIGVEPAGRGLEANQHAATLTLGRPGIIHGMNTYLLQDENNQISSVHSIASGLDYPGVGPIHAFLKEEQRIKYETIRDDEAIKAFTFTARYEGIIPALESAHALAYAYKISSSLAKDKILVVNLSGRGDKDLDFVSQNFPQIDFKD
jgi:tryptophan synthase beta chain